MEEVIDLRPYIKSLISRWHLILGVTVVTSIIFLGVSLLLPPKYQAVALITISNSDQLTLSSLTFFDLDPTLAQETQPDPLARIYADLSKSDELLLLVLEEIKPLLDEDSTIDSVDDLKDKLRIRVGTDFSLLILSVEDTDPQLATDLVNAWATLFAAWVNEKFDSQDLRALEFFEQQLLETDAELETAEAALVQHQSVNNTITISNTLNFRIETQQNYLHDKQTLIAIRQDVENLQNQLLMSPAGATVSVADQLTAVTLQLKSFNPRSVTLEQIQIDSGASLIGNNRQENIDFLIALASSIEAKINFIDASLQEIEPEILLLQSQLEAALSEYRNLVRDRDVAGEAYLAVSREVTEKRLNVAQQQSDNTIVVSQATTPSSPTGSRRIFYAIIGGVIGFFLMVISIIVHKWWQEFDDDAAA